MMICDMPAGGANPQQKMLDEHDVMRLIERCRPRNGSIDEDVIEKGAELLENGRELSIEGFTLLAMHLDPNSKHAPLYHKYAHARFKNQSDLDLLATLSRIGTPLREVAADEHLRAEVEAVRSGRQVIPSPRLQAEMSVNEPNERIREILEKLRRVLG